MKTLFLRLFNNPTLRLMFRYGIVGVVASVIHWLVSYWVFNSFHTEYLLAHSIGFFSGLIPAYIGHYFFSFKDQQKHKKRFPKFFIVSSLAFFIHETGAYLLVEKAGLDYSSMALPLLVILVPVFSFLLNRFWVFSNTSEFK